MKTIDSNQDPTQPSAEYITTNSLPSPGIIKRLTIRDTLDVVIVRTTVRKLAEQLGYDLVDQVRLGKAAFELIQLMVSCAGRGEILILWYEGTQGIGLKCCCCCPAPPTVYSNGAKKSTRNPDFSKLKRLVDEFEYIEDPQRGDSVAITIWLKRGSQPEI